jgi:LytTr DNA-binding domain
MSQASSLFATPREWVIDLAITTAIGVFLGVIGPFGSYYGGGLELRVIYWVVNACIGFTVISIAVRLSIRVAIRLDLPIWFALAAGVAIGALPLDAILAVFSAWFWPPNHGRISSLLIQYGQILAISEPFSFGYYFLADRGWRAAVAQARARGALCDPADTQGGHEPGGGFLDRLPPRLGRDLLCLQMEDHYVRAHTAKGSDLVLTPLKDAVAELGGTDGLQVHRSWWVARDAVAEPLASGRNLSLRLRNGLEVPVSRASVAKLRAAGWLDPE